MLTELWLLGQKFIATFGVAGLAAFWALKAWVTWVVLRWWKNRRRIL